MLGTRRFPRRTRGILFTAALLAASGSIPHARADAPPVASEGEDAVAVAWDSPQATIGRFLSLARRGRFDRAGEYLDVAHRSRAPESAEHLLLVLDREVWIDVERLSPASLGDTDDGLPRGIDEIGVAPSPEGGASEPIRIARTMTADGPRWRFSRATCARIDPWYRALDGRMLRELVPPAMRHDGPFHIQPWQWVGLLGFTIAAFVLGVFVGRLNEYALVRIARRTRPTWDDALGPALRTPLRLGWALAALHLALPFLGLARPAEAMVVRFEKLLCALVFLIASIRVVGVVSDNLSRSEWGRSNPASRSLVGLSSRAGQLAAFLAAVLMTLSTLGYDVTGVLTGLGVGGVVLALAAQKTLENLLGAFAIGIDQPLREGDFVRVGEVTGTVERVGLRSTRIRTLERHVVSFPNGKLADTPIESLSSRDRMRFAMTLGLQHGTSVAILRALRDELDSITRGMPFVLPEDVIVRISGASVTSLELDVIAYVKTRDPLVFAEHRETLVLALLDAVEKNGVALATAPRPVIAPV